MLENTLSPSEYDLLERLKGKLEMQLTHIPDAVMKFRKWETFFLQFTSYAGY